MRVLFLTHRLPYAPNRGDRIRAHHLLRTLSRDDEVHVFSFVHDRDEERHAGDLREYAASVTTVRTARLRNLVRATAALGGTMPLTHLLLDAPGVDDAVDRAAALSRPDVVLSYCTGVARLAFAPALADLPFVLDMVDVDSAKWQTFAARSGPVKRWIYAREHRCLSTFERVCAARAHATLVVNAREAEALRAVAPTARTVVVGNGVDVAHMRGPSIPRRREVVFCGVFNYAPNAEAAEWIAGRVWPLVRARCPDATLSLVGASPTRAVRALHSPAAGIAVSGTVADVRPFLWRAAVAAAPLSVARGVQNKVLEAVAAGLPAVVTGAVFDGLPSEVRRACTVADDERGFAAALVWLLDQPDSSRMRLVQQADVERLSWETRLAVVRTLLREACGAERRTTYAAEDVSARLA